MYNSSWAVTKDSGYNSVTEKSELRCSDLWTKQNIIALQYTEWPKNQLTLKILFQ